MLAGCFAISIATFIILGSHTHPAKDDYLSAMMFRDKCLWDSLRIQYGQHNGRLLSALIMRFSPLQYHSFAGYKAVCIGFVVLFAASLFLYVNYALSNRLHAVDRASVFFVLYCCLHGALGNLAEFYFWLPAISCYGAGALLFLLLLRLLPTALQKGHNTGWAWIMAASIVGGVIPFCGEPCAVMSFCALCLFSIKTLRDRELSMVAAVLILVAMLAGCTIAALSPGNALRIATSPHSRGVLQTLSGTAYSMSGDLLRMLYFLIPGLIFCGILNLCANPGTTISRRRVLLPMLIVCASWAASEMVVFYGIGGMAALRVRNSILFHGAVLFLVSLLHGIRGTERKAAWPTAFARFVMIGSSVWIMLGIFMAGNPVSGGMLDCISGVASRYDHDMNKVYLEASRSGPADSFLKVSPVREIPASLFVAQPLILENELYGWPWFNVKMAGYFGHKRLYADSLAATPGSEEAFQQWIRSRRAETFR